MLTHDDWLDAMTALGSYDGPTDFSSITEQCRVHEIRYEVSHCVVADGLVGPYCRVSIDGDLWFEEFGQTDTSALVLALAAMQRQKEKS